MAESKWTLVLYAGKQYTMPQPLEFISVSGTNVKGDAETRKRVRSRAQADYRRRNPPPPRPALAVELDVPSWLNSLSQEATPKLYPCMKPTRKVNAKGHTNTRALKEESLSDDSNLFALMTPHQQQRAQKLWNHRQCFLPGCNPGPSTYSVLIVRE